MEDAEQPVRLADGVRALLDAVAAFNAEQRRLGIAQTVEDARNGLRDLTRRFVTRNEPVDIVHDATLAADARDIPLRLYHPVPDEALPVLLFIHGGGHVAGSVDVYDPLARRLANATRHLVVAIDYRLAPEHPYPAGLDDVLAVARGLDRLLAATGMRYVPRVAIAGDSGGGALTASASHRLRADAGVAIDSQVLIYPSLDYTLSQPSVERWGRGYLLERERIEWYFDRYLGPGVDRRAVSPLFMPGTHGLPRTLVITAAYCPLCDEGADYAARLDAAGIEVSHLRVDGAIHACLNLEDLLPDSCATIYAAIAQFLAHG